jgi:hypothetical protein
VERLRYTVENVRIAAQTWLRFKRIGTETLQHIRCVEHLEQHKKKLEFFFDRFSKNSQILNLMKIRFVRAELFHADRETDRWRVGQTDKTKLIVGFRKCSGAPNKICP